MEPKQRETNLCTKTFTKIKYLWILVKAKGHYCIGNINMICTIWRFTSIHKVLAGCFYAFSSSQKPYKLTKAIRVTKKRCQRLIRRVEPLPYKKLPECEPMLLLFHCLPEDFHILF